MSAARHIHINKIDADSCGVFFSMPYIFLRCGQVPCGIGIVLCCQFLQG